MTTARSVSADGPMNFQTWWTIRVPLAVVLAACLQQTVVLPFHHPHQFRTSHHPRRPRSPRLLSSRFCARSSRGSRKTCRSKDGRDLRCAAVALSLSPASSVGEDTTDEHGSSDVRTSTAHNGGTPVEAPPNRGVNTGRESDARTVVGDIILSDWLEVLPSRRDLPTVESSQKDSPTDEEERQLVSYVEGGAAVDGLDGDVKSGLGAGEGDKDEESTPFKFQQLIQVGSHFRSPATGWLVMSYLPLCSLVAVTTTFEGGWSCDRVPP